MILEERRILGGHYTVWGTYHHDVEYEELHLPIMGIDFGFTPNLALRTELLLSFVEPIQWELIQREWTISENERTVRHRSGVLFSFPVHPHLSLARIKLSQANGSSDSAVMHPALESSVLRHLSTIAYTLFCRFLKGQQPTGSALKLQSHILEPLYTWTHLT